ncbi:MAG: UDP-2,3-diacylglucosamine diphosphatase [Bdellovibrionia bacterium]
MSLIAVSDLHIWGPQDPVYASLIALIQLRAKPSDTLVLAGDLFDVWVGNKTIFLHLYSSFFNQIQAAAQRGVRIYYIEGNHDFMMKKVFEKIPGVTVCSRTIQIEVQGKIFHCAHGDLVDPRDYGYRLLRLFFRSPLMKALVALVPGEWLSRFGQFSSQKSRSQHKNLPLAQMEYLRRTFRSYAAERISQGADFVILGHCHDLDEMSFHVGNRAAQYINIGFPRIHGSFLSWNPGDPKIQREKLPPSC